MKTRLALFCATAWCALAPQISFAQFVIQPDEAASKDTWVYSFLPTTNNNGVGSNIVLTAGNTPPLPPANTEHDLQTLIQFDLTGAPQNVTSATLNLYLIDPNSFNANALAPSIAKPVDLSVHGITGTWEEGTAVWNNRPAFNATAEDSLSVTAINTWATFDVTDLVQSWIDNPSTNNGFLIQQTNTMFTGVQFHMGAFYSSNASVLQPPFLALPQFRPFLSVVPEPSGFALMGTAFAAIGMIRRRRVR